MDAPYSAKATAKRTTERLARERGTITIQGGLVQLKTTLLSARKQPKNKRGEIAGFSEASRFNLLKWIARIDWEKLPAGMFVTLTYPDEKCAADVATATMHRSHMVRYFEKRLKEKLPILWRKEAVDRKSGAYTGIFVSHFHLCVFTKGRITPDYVNDCWRKCIGWKWEVQVNVQPMTSGEHAAFYLAKYLTKRSTEGILDYPAYLTNPGRAWGFCRKNLIPLAPVLFFSDISPRLYAEMLVIARELWPNNSAQAYESFSLLGSAADKFSSILKGKLP